MARLLNRWFKLLQISRSEKRRPAAPRRRLRTETLETRQLLAANLFHNQSMPEDVNNDGVISAVDALTVINEMNRQRSGDTNNTVNELGFRPDVNNDGRHTSLDALMVINRLNRERNRHSIPDDTTRNPDTSPGGGDDPAVDVRAIDGSNNNLENPDYGAANTTLLRVAEADYADGISEPAGTDRPSAREISNTLSAAN
uniref:dockerin type I domain-containing protein n=1 Tax=Novipirellula sp. TaxID=2795430 RepID=UPI00356660CC